MASFKKLLVSGTGLLGKSLGSTNFLGFFVNAVELQFDIDAATRAASGGFVARQWCGPEVQWVKRGSPLLAPWQRLPADPNSGGADDPDPLNVSTGGAVAAYYDSPGPNIYAVKYAGARRIHVVQNFTGWIEATGSGARVTDVASWFSIVDIGNSSDDPADKSASNWSFTALTSAGTGWRDVGLPPAI